MISNEKGREEPVLGDIGMKDCHSVSVVDIDQLSFLVELQVKFVGQFHIVAVALLVDLDDGGTSEMSLHIVGDGSRHEVSGNGAEVAVHLVYCTVLVELQFGAIVQAYLIGGSSEVPINFGVGDGLTREGILDVFCSFRHCKDKPRYPLIPNIFHFFVSLRCDTILHLRQILIMPIISVAFCPFCLLYHGF